MTKTPDIAQEIIAIEQMDVTPMILKMMTHLTGMGFAAIARVTDTRWIACAVRDLVSFGLKPGDELPLEMTICDEIRCHHEKVVINQVSTDPVYAGHPAPLRYRFESYVSIPIFRANGDFFGTLCALDAMPAKLDAATVETLTLLAELISAKLDAEDRLEASAAALVAEREINHMREQFMAVLGHDLRSPLAAVKIAAGLIASSSDEARSQRLAEFIKGGVDRMAELIDHILDFARGQLGGGISLGCSAVSDLHHWLEQLVTQMQLAHDNRQIQMHFSIDQPIVCDRGRLGQLVSNLLNNAITHGSVDGVIKVEATVDAGDFVLTVSNEGQIPDDVVPSLFKPFTRATSKPRSGLGLGLYIASEIAKAHAGSLSATTGADGTCFMLRFPLDAHRATLVS